MMKCKTSLLLLYTCSQKLIQTPFIWPQVDFSDLGPALIIKFQEEYNHTGQMSRERNKILNIRGKSKENGIRTEKDKLERQYASQQQIAIRISQEKLYKQYKDWTMQDPEGKAFLSHNIFKINYLCLDIVTNQIILTFMGLNCKQFLKFCWFSPVIYVIIAI